ncbi:MAG: AMP-binding protein, partial [Thauera sp.]
MYLTQLLHRNLQRRPGRDALVCGSTRRTYSQLHDRVARLAGHLKRLGVQRGDRIAVLSLNSVECVEIMLAAWWIGAVFCPVNTRWSVPEIATSFDDCTPEVLFVDATHAVLADPVCERTTCLRHIVQLTADGDTNASPDSYPALLATAVAISDERVSGDHLAALVYTGGTTGRSKGVMLTHQTLWAASLAKLAGAEPLLDSVTLVATPIFHVAGVVWLVPHLTAGGCCVVLPQFKADEAIELIERECITEIAIVPSMLQMILDHPEFTPQRLRSVRRLNYGAAPSAGALLQRAARTLPWTGLYQAYGMTESMGVGTVSFPSDHRPEDWASGRALSAGQACMVAELRVVDVDGNDAAVGEVGEIVLRGPNVSPGYWNRPEETAQTFRDGWLHTGDAGK